MFKRLVGVRDRTMKHEPTPTIFSAPPNVDEQPQQQYQNPSFIFLESEHITKWSPAAGCLLLEAELGCYALDQTVHRSAEQFCTERIHCHTGSALSRYHDDR